MSDKTVEWILFGVLAFLVGFLPAVSAMNDWGWISDRLKYLLYMAFGIGIVAVLWIATMFSLAAPPRKIPRSNRYH